MSVVKIDLASASRSSITHAWLKETQISDSFNINIEYSILLLLFWTTLIAVVFKWHFTGKEVFEMYCVLIRWLALALKQTHWRHHM